MSDKCDNDIPPCFSAGSHPIAFQSSMFLTPPWLPANTREAKSSLPCHHFRVIKSPCVTRFCSWSPCHSGDSHWIPFSVRLHASQECSELLTVAVVTIIKRLKCEKKNMGYPSKHIISCYFNIMLCIVVMLVIVMVMRRMNTCCMGLGWLLVVVSSHYGWFYGKWQVFYFLHMYAHTFFGYIQYWHPWHLFNKLSLVLRRAPPRVGLSNNGMPTENHQQKTHGKMQTEWAEKSLP